MHSHSIKDLWDLPELKITATNKINHQIFIDVMPTEPKQACPICASEIRVVAESAMFEKCGISKRLVAQFI